MSTPERPECGYVEMSAEQKQHVYGDYCLYDELFGFDLRTGETCDADTRARNAIEATCEAIRQFALRHYGREYNRKDREHSAAITRKGTAGTKLAYVLLMLTNEDSLREIITSGIARESAADTVNPALARERMRKAIIFYRVLAIATRSLFETPFTETTSPMYVLMFLEICAVAWVCMDAAAMSMYCDFFSARWKFDLRCDDGGLFDHDTLYTRLATAQDISADRAKFNVEDVCAAGGRLAVISTKNPATFFSSDGGAVPRCEFRSADAISARPIAKDDVRLPESAKKVSLPSAKRRTLPLASAAAASADNGLHPPFAKRPKLIFLSEPPERQKSSSSSKRVLKK